MIIHHHTSNLHPTGFYIRWFTSELSKSQQRITYRHHTITQLKLFSQHTRHETLDVWRETLLSSHFTLKISSWLSSLKCLWFGLSESLITNQHTYPIMHCRWHSVILKTFRNPNSFIERWLCKHTHVIDAYRHLLWIAWASVMVTSLFSDLLWYHRWVSL